MVQFGVDIILGKAPSAKRIALVTNDAATTCEGVKTRMALLKAGWNIVLLFSPEHGIDTEGEDGKKMINGVDKLTGLPIVSLYGQHLIPTAEQLVDIDEIWFDIPDVGCRFYTFLWTLTYILEASAFGQKPLLILDRPNPLSGRLSLAEGPLLDEANCGSFIGRWNIPLRHSCTLGELALYFNRTRGIHAPLQIVCCEDWDRNMFFPDCGTSFVPTSPAMQAYESMHFYPGTGLLEATNLSEGRGGPAPFALFGAPWLKVNAEWVRQVNKKLIGATLAIEDFTPSMGEHAGQKCIGLRFYASSLKETRPVWNMLLVLKEVYDNNPQSFKWSTYPTHVNPTGENHLDLLLGVKNSGKTFDLTKNAFNLFWQEKLHIPDWENGLALLY